MTFNEFDQLVERYLRGECTAEEEKLIEEGYATWLDEAPDVLNADRKLSVENKLWAALEQKKQTDKQRWLTGWKLTGIAATLLVLAASLWIFNSISGQSFSSLPQQGEEKEISNHGLASMEVVLEDGSKILLEPGSSLRYFSESFLNNREVDLAGEAFFDVVKDKKHPFLVHTSEITTRVLGTSFRIKAYDNARDIVVSVTSGRVLVSKEHAYRKTTRGDDVVLTPNQEFVYDKEVHKTEKKLVEVPMIVLPESTLKTHYTNAPVTEIFDAIARNYGVGITYDKTILSQCMVSTSLANEGFYDKIEIICEAIGARYSVQGTDVKIESAGCD